MLKKFQKILKIFKDQINIILILSKVDVTIILKKKN